MRLSGDAGMVCARLPQHILAAHALEASEDILQRVVEGVADMQPPGHIGRRDDDGKRLRAGTVARLESAGRLPLGSDAFLNVGGVESLVEHKKNQKLGKWHSRSRGPAGP